MTTRVIIGRELFPTLTPALASHWAASLTAMLFTATVPPRVAAQGNVLFQTPAEYATAGILFGELRRRFIDPLAHLLLYELVCQEKRAEIAQALTQQRGAAQAVGDVDDYSALKELLSSPAFTLLESLEDAVWAKGVAVALQSTSAVAGATRTVVLAMRQEQNDLFNYATVGHEIAIAAGRANNALAVFTIGDLCSCRPRTPPEENDSSARPRGLQGESHSSYPSGSASHGGNHQAASTAAGRRCPERGQQAGHEREEGLAVNVQLRSQRQTVGQEGKAVSTSGNSR